MAAGVATLGLEGIVRDPNAQVDYLMCCFFFTQVSQGNIFQNLTSLPKLIQEFGNNQTLIRKEVEDTLNVFLRRYFQSVSVAVRATDEAYPGISLQIEAIVSTGPDIEQNSVSVGYSLLTRDSQLKRIVRDNNGDTDVIYTA